MSTLIQLLHASPAVRRFVKGSAFIALMLLMAGSLEARPLVESVTMTERSDGQGYVIRFHTSQKVNAYHDPQPVDDHTIAFTLYNTALARSYSQEKAAGPIQNYTVRSEKGHLTFRFELDPDASVVAEAYRDRASSDLLVNLTYGDSRRHAEAVAPRAVNTSDSAARSASGERWKLDTIVIDAGHGGKDPGASAYGVREKDVVLSIARKLGAYIEQKTDMNVVYTRDTDRFVELRERGRIANKSGGKLFVSIHANAARDRRAHGTETYFLGMHRTETARKVMERENSVISMEDNPEQYQTFGDSPIMQSLMQSAYMRKSEQLAGFVQEQFEERVERKNRGVKQAGFLVLWAASMPAILVETGFITNRSDASFLSSSQGQTYLASAIFRAIRAFKTQYEKGLDLASHN